MDSHPASYTTPSRRNSSKTYQDLASFRLYGITRIEPLSYRMGAFVKYRVLRPSTPPHVGIIGAGVAGLRCADVLLQHGFRVTILEGRDRVGGRMHQVYLPNTTRLIDIGPNWIHGTDHNPILDLAKETDTATHSWGEKINLFDETGRHISDKEATEYNEVMWGIFTEAFKYSNANTVSIPTSESLYDFFVNKIKEFLPETENDFEKKRKMVLRMAKMWGAFVGSTIKTQSLKFFWLEETIEGENLFCAGTYQKILARIAKPAVEKADIKFLTKVVSINATEEQDRKVVIRTDQKEELQFDEVVVTAPLGWLKKNEKAFTPSLPPRLSSAINSIGYGCLEKVYISFPRAFWLSSPPGKTSHSNADPQPLIVEPNIRGFSQFISPKFSPLNPQHWNQEVLELGSLPLPSSHPTLLFYIFGAQSIALTSSLLRLPAQKDRHNLVTKFFQPYYSRLPNYADSNPDCIPISSYATEWLNDELAGNGSYSNFQIGLGEGDRDIEVMREGVPGRGLWFAGEHTAPFVASGTVTGAYWSGEGVGKRLAEAYGMLENSQTLQNGVGVVQNVGLGNEREITVRAFSDLTLEE